MINKVSIVIPCYNEAKNIPLILQRFNQTIGNYPIEVILVDNGSFDNSAEVLRQLISLYPFAKTVKVKINQGYGYGILCGLQEASGDFLGWTHADMQTDPADIIRAYNILEQHNFSKTLFLKGTRRKRALFDVFFTIGMSIFESLYLNAKLWDINAQPTIFHKNFYQTWQNPPHDFALDLYALYMAKRTNLTLLRFPVLFPKRIHGQSTWNTSLAAKWKFIKRTIKFSINLKKELKHALHRPPN